MDMWRQIFFMDVERDAFVSSLAKFTLLHTTDKEMKQKNIDTIKTVLSIGYTEGNCLEASWGLIQRSISQLDRMHLMGAGARDDASFFGAVDENSQKARAPKKGKQVERGAVGSNWGLGVISQQEIENATSLMDQVDRNSIDRIYANSSHLNSDAVIHFVTNLCEVSMEELICENPRIFSLQKIVESASVNMNRVRLVWGKIWKVLAAHFTRVGCHSNQNIAMFAIDSLRQLAYKFLEKDELSNFNFQQEFLLPFEHIVANSQNVQIRELVVCCVDQMSQARAKNLISGWRSALNVLTIAAGDADEMIINLGFHIAEAVVKEHFQEITEVFVDLTNCMVAFGRNKINTTVSLKAITDLHVLCGKLACGEVFKLVPVSVAPFT